MPTDTTMYGVDSGITLKILRDDIFSELKEDPTDPVFWTTAEFTTLINRGLQTFCEKAKLFMMYDEIDSVQDNMVYNLKLGIAEIIAVGYDGSDITANQINVDKIDIISSGTPDKWGRYGLGAIFLNAIPNTAGKKILVLYSGRHTVLSGDTDPIFIDNESILEGVKDYVKWKALEKDGDGKDQSKANHFRKAYWGALDYARTLTSNQGPGMAMGEDH